MRWITWPIMAAVFLAVVMACSSQATDWGPVQTLTFDGDDLPENLCSMVTGDTAASVLRYRLPADYDPERTYPLVLYVPGHHGRRGGNLQNAMDIGDGHDCVVASLPLFKAGVDRTEIGEGLIVGFAVIAIGYFVPPFDKLVDSIHEFHFLGLVFSWLLILMLVIGEIKPRETEFEQEDVGAVDMTPWRLAKPVGLLLVVIVLLIYVTFADFSVLAD